MPVPSKRGTKTKKKLKFIRPGKTTISAPSGEFDLYYFGTFDIN